jgi:hypothetical protein
MQPGIAPEPGNDARSSRSGEADSGYATRAGAGTPRQSEDLRPVVETHVQPASAVC